MPYRVRWLVENKVLHNMYFGEVTGQELRENIVDADTLTIKVPKEETFHVLAESRYVTGYPLKLNDIVKLALEGRPQYNLGYTILITRNRMITFLVSTVLKMLNTQFRAYQTSEEAFEFLQQITLETLPLPAPESYDSYVQKECTSSPASEKGNTDGLNAS